MVILSLVIQTPFFYPQVVVQAIELVEKKYFNFSRSFKLLLTCVVQWPLEEKFPPFYSYLHLFTYKKGREKERKEGSKEEGKKEEKAKLEVLNPGHMLVSPGEI